MVNSFSVALNPTLAVPTVVLKDTTDWAGQGLNVAYFVGYITCLDPSGTPFNNSAITYFNGASLLPITVNLPLAQTPDGLFPPLGTYTFTVSYQYTASSTATITNVVTNTSAYLFTIPKTVLIGTSSCITGILNGTDATDYEDVIGATLTSYVRIMKFIPPNDPSTNTFITPVQTTSLKTFNIGYPDLYTGGWQITLSTACVYTLTDGTVVNITITGAIPVDVTCDKNICCIRECLETQVCLWANNVNQNINPVVTQALYNNVIAPLFGYYMLYYAAFTCGKYDNCDKQVAKMKAILKANNCNCDCNDNNSDSPQQVIPLIPSSVGNLNIIVTNGDSNITVTTAVISGVTYYYVKLSTGFIATITTINGNIGILQTNIAALNLILGNNLFEFNGIANNSGNVQLTGISSTTGLVVGEAINVEQNLGFINAGYNGATTILSINSSTAITINVAFVTADAARTGYIYFGAVVSSKYIKLYELDTNSVSLGAGQNTLASFVV